MMKKAALIFVLLGAMISAGCENSDPITPPQNQTATVLISYRATTVLDPRVASQFPLCVQRVVRTQAHPGWREFVRSDMAANGNNEWLISFPDVPVNQDVRIRINDPNACATDANGAATQNVFANNVRLVRVVQTPGNGFEPGLAFRVAPGGAVTP